MLAHADPAPPTPEPTVPRMQIDGRLALGAGLENAYFLAQVDATYRILPFLLIGGYVEDAGAGASLTDNEFCGGGPCPASPSYFAFGPRVELQPLPKWIVGPWLGAELGVALLDGCRDSTCGMTVKPAAIETTFDSRGGDRPIKALAPRPVHRNEGISPPTPTRTTPRIPRVLPQPSWFHWGCASQHGSSLEPPDAPSSFRMNGTNVVLRFVVAVALLSAPARATPSSADFPGEPPPPASSAAPAPPPPEVSVQAPPPTRAPTALATAAPAPTTEAKPALWYGSLRLAGTPAYSGEWSYPDGGNSFKGGYLLGLTTDVTYRVSRNIAVGVGAQVSASMHAEPLVGPGQCACFVSVSVPFLLALILPVGARLERRSV